MPCDWEGGLCLQRPTAILRAGPLGGALQLWGRPACGRGEQTGSRGPGLAPGAPGRWFWLHSRSEFPTTGQRILREGGWRPGSVPGTQDRGWQRGTALAPNRPDTPPFSSIHFLVKVYLAQKKDDIKVLT